MSGKNVIFPIALVGLAVLTGCKKSGGSAQGEAIDSNMAEKSIAEKEGKEEFDSIHFIEPGVISHYDEIFRREGEAHNLDWRLLAAVGYTESRFHENLVSSAGAIGMMQLMPSVAKSLGFSREEMMNPELSIRAGAMSLEKIIRWIGDRYNHQSEENLMKIAIATYNCGPLHIEDAMAIAKMQGLDPGVWESNLEIALTQKGNPQVYGMPVVRSGKFSGAKETKAFVERVFNTYNIYKKAGIAG